MRADRSSPRRADRRTSERWSTASSAVGIGILFAIGGDGTLRGALRRSRRRRCEADATIAVIGIPKTIDNDISMVQQSFGFDTAVTETRDAIYAANAEANGARNGIGLVKLMGRHSGFIAAYATLAHNDVNFCLVPEVPFRLEAFLARPRARASRAAGHAVVVVAEGAGQDLLRVRRAAGTRPGTCASPTSERSCGTRSRRTSKRRARGQPEVHRPELHDPERARERARLGLLPRPGTSRGARRDVRPDRHARRLRDERIHARADRRGDRATAGRSIRRAGSGRRWSRPRASRSSWGRMPTGGIPPPNLCPP